MTRFRLDIHIAPDVAGNLVDRADQYPIRESIEYDTYDNAAATEHAVALITEHGQAGDIGRVMRQDNDNWWLLGEVRPPDTPRRLRVGLLTQPPSRRCNASGGCE
jgi:hypothetical protein